MSITKIEVCAYSVQSALNAQTGGADRVELCTNMYEGGTTPGYAEIKLARKLLNIDLNVMIRPRGGDFCYSDIEFELMKIDIEQVKEAGADGIVIGLLTENAEIDSERTSELISLAQPMSVTLHRAFDKAIDPLKSMESLIEIGVDRILTSGQNHSAYEGKELIKQMVEKAEGRIIIMPGGGINKNNVNEILDYTGVSEIHLSGKKLTTGRMRNINDVKMNALPDIPENDIYETDSEIIKEVAKIVRSYK